MKQLFVLLLICGYGSSENKFDGSNTLPATALHAYGRSVMNGQRLELISSAVHFGFSFKGDQCQIFTSLSYAGAHSYLQYELDGKYQKRIRIEGVRSNPVTIKAATGGKHTVWIYKATEAHTGP